LRQGHYADEIMQVFARVGRNEPCPCGSGQKAKSCHQSWSLSSWISWSTASGTNDIHNRARSLRSGQIEEGGSQSMGEGQSLGEERSPSSAGGECHRNCAHGLDRRRPGCATPGSLHLAKRVL